MLNELSISEAQQVAEQLVRPLIDNADVLDPSAIAEVLVEGLQVDYVQDLVAALLGERTDDLPDWIAQTLDEPDPDDY